MIESATGVVLRTQRLTETSLIVRWLTRDLGRLSTVAKGARRPKSVFTGKLDLFIEADFTFTRSRRSDLHTLRELSPTQFHLSLRNDVGRLQVAAYCTTLLEQATESDTPLPGLFALFRDLLDQLSRGEARPRLVFAYELKLLDLLGLFPSLEHATLKPATRELASALAEDEWNAIQNLKPKADAVKELSSYLQGFLLFHLGKVPKTRSAALRA